MAIMKFIIAAAIISLVYAVVVTAITYGTNVYNGGRWNTMREVSVFVATFVGTVISLLLFSAFCKYTRFGQQCITLFSS
jgi:hypothetical protein